MRTWVLLGIAALLGACRTSPSLTPSAPDVALSRAPFTRVHAAYKERLELTYVFVEVRGSYASAGRHLSGLAASMQEQGLEPSGPPFGLFYDDPGQVGVDQLKARLCFPVETAGEVREPLSVDRLPGGTVAYAQVDGAYPEVPRCYPGLLAYVREMHWAVAGPIREIYLVPPGTVKDWSELRCEVQVPVAMAP